MKKHVVIVAGGSGSRMKSETPKQFLVLQNLPVLMHTLTAFHLYDPTINIILVLPENQIPYWNELKKTYQFNITHQVALGGSTRFDSVNNGLQSVEKNSLVAIHDGARPLVTQATIGQTFDKAQQLGNAIAAVPLKDSLREIISDHNIAVDRSNYMIVQTPQTFRSELIKEAFGQASHSSFSDDASVFESNGGRINLVDGDYTNLKITTPEDLIVAEEILKKM
ncbi:MAG: 2-C-methyl-D-erythritol 4-phosphate cytidylyltransferase [Reichenbachiella sp.]